MRLRKEILLFYLLILASAGIIIAAEQPKKVVFQPKNNSEKPVKCCKLKKQKATPSLNYISEGILRYKA